MHRNPASPAPSAPAARLAGAALSSVALSAVLVVTSLGSDSHLGAPAYWPWLLTGLQVLGLWAAGVHRWWGWLLGAGVQIPWITYALLTTQLGFVPGCAISAAVQSYSFVKSRSPRLGGDTKATLVRRYA